MRSPHRCGRPGIVDAGAVREQPAARERFGEPRALLARGRGGEIAQPGEALQLVGDRAAGAERGEIEFLERDRLAAEVKAAGEQSVAALAVAMNMVARNGDQLERLLDRARTRDRRGPLASLRDDARSAPRRLPLIPRP